MWSPNTYMEVIIEFHNSTDIENDNDNYDTNNSTSNKSAVVMVTAVPTAGDLSYCVCCISCVALTACSTEWSIWRRSCIE